MNDNIITVGLVVRKQDVLEELKKIIPLVDGFHYKNSSNPQDCDVLIIEIGEDTDKEFEFIQSLQNVGSVKDIFLTSSCIESHILIRAMRCGAREFFPQPIIQTDLVTALKNFKARNKQPISHEKILKKGKIITFVGSKGGIGTTTIAVNYATSLLEANKPTQSVALIDMNLLFGEVPIFLDLQPAFNWGEVAKNISRLDSTYLMSILSRHQSGIYVLPSPWGFDGSNAATPQIIDKILRLLQRDFDYIVVDSGQSLDSIFLKVLELTDVLMINALLSLPCLINVKRLFETFRRLGYPREENIEVIINRYHKNSIISTKEAEKALEKKIFWFIPNDYQNTISALNQGKTLSAVAPKANITKNIKELISKTKIRREPDA